MTAADAFARWQEQNREFLALAVDDLFNRIERRETTATEEQMLHLATGMDRPPALDRLTDAFSLSGFERDVVLLCLASELDPRFRTEARPVTVGLALEELDGANWSALDLSSPLRSWGIVVVDRLAALADASIRLSEDVLRFLLGFDPRMESDAPFVIAPSSSVLLARQAAIGEELALTIARAAAVSREPPAVELHGGTEEDRIAVVVACADALGAAVAAADSRDLPLPGVELDDLLRSWSRRAHLTSTVLCVSISDLHDEDPRAGHRIERCLAGIRGPLFLSVARPRTGEAARTVLRRAIEPLTAEERLGLWEAHVKAARARLRSRRTRGLAAELAGLARDYRLGPRTVQRACLEAEAVLAARDRPVEPGELAALLRASCAQSVRARLDPLAERIELKEIGELSLPEQEALQFYELQSTIRLSTEVGARWGIDRGRSNGITALFAGPSGTGKTHAAFVLARRLGLDLYRVNLASVLSKYIGETEKNLDRIFDAAGVGGVILLFDEADALFGKRSEVRDSHDRYANLSTAYLLSRIENAPTPTILTTNIKEAIDPAFIRRLQFVIDFPFPTARERAEIWREVYPKHTPVGELEPERLSLVAATGGTITNIARRGAYLAAAEPTVVQMRHLLEASRLELRKLGRELTPEELGVWR